MPERPFPRRMPGGGSPRPGRRPSARPSPRERGRSWRSYDGSTDGEVQAFVLDEAFAQVLGGFQPVLAFGQVDAAGADGVQLRLIHGGWDGALLGQVTGGGEQPPPDTDDHAVAAAQVLA